MRLRPRARLRLRALAAPALLAAACSAASGCELVVRQHRGGQELARLALSAVLPQARIMFTHSVLGTPVVDRYVWRDGRWTLVEETFEGAGYGLPHGAAPGETLARSATGWRLALDRVVDPLVVRPLAAERMRIVIDGQPELVLARIATQAVELRAAGCDAR